MNECKNKTLENCDKNKCIYVSTKKMNYCRTRKKTKQKSKAKTKSKSKSKEKSKSKSIVSKKQFKLPYAQVLPPYQDVKYYKEYKLKTKPKKKKYNYSPNF